MRNEWDYGPEGSTAMRCYPRVESNGIDWYLHVMQTTCTATGSPNLSREDVDVHPGQPGSRGDACDNLEQKEGWN